jgi:XTP/dITP diphosphohydrolase
VRGECPGIILEAPRGTEGFGYDPLFYYEPAGKTFAELTADEKNEVSHRARALTELKEMKIIK